MRPCAIYEIRFFLFFFCCEFLNILLRCDTNISLHLSACHFELRSDHTRCKWKTILSWIEISIWFLFNFVNTLAKRATKVFWFWKIIWFYYQGSFSTLNYTFCERVQNFQVHLFWKNPCFMILYTLLGFNSVSDLLIFTEKFNVIQKIKAKQNKKKKDLNINEIGPYNFYFILFWSCKTTDTHLSKICNISWCSHTY